MLIENETPNQEDSLRKNELDTSEGNTEDTVSVNEVNAPDSAVKNDDQKDDPEEASSPEEDQISASDASTGDEQDEKTSEEQSQLADESDTADESEPPVNEVTDPEENEEVLSTSPQEASVTDQTSDTEEAKVSASEESADHDQEDSQGSEVVQDSDERVSESAAAVSDSNTETQDVEGNSSQSNEDTIASASVSAETPKPATEHTEPSEDKKPEQYDSSVDDDMWSGWVVLGEQQEGLLQRVDEILDEEQSARLLDASAEDLIALLEKYVEGDIEENIPKVGLIKRSFDAIRAKSEVSEELTEQFRVALANFNKKRVELQKQQEAQKFDNAKKKRELLAKLKEVVDSEDVHRIQEVKDIQGEWKAIGHIPKKDMEEMYRTYRTLLDTFYQRREMHFELLEYDRKINLQEKEKLIEDAKTLVPDPEDRDKMDVWKIKMDHFREIQEQWKSIGHVPREDLERIRDEFRSTIDQFFEARQQFLEILDSQKEENQAKKEELLEKMKEYSAFTAKKPREWNEATQRFRELQETWKALGPAPKAVNNELWQQYRDVADTFFSNKSGYFKALDEKRAENLTRKQELCEKAEELKNSGEWEKTARALKQIQTEWKKVGPVPERYSNKLWNRFKAACDAFFEQRRLHYQALHETEHVNLEKKRKLIEEVVKLADDDDKDIDISIERIKELQAEWQSIGKVPYKEKDKIWEEFRKEIDRFFNGLSGKREKLREVRLKSSIEMISDPDRRSRQIKAKISRLRKQIHKAEEKVEQYSNNIMFIAKGKSGDPLRKQIQDELDKERAEIKDMKQKVKMLNEMLKNPPKPGEEDSQKETDENTNETPADKKSGESGVSSAEDTSDEKQDQDTAKSSESDKVVATPTPDAQADDSTSDQEATSDENTSTKAEAPKETEEKVVEEEKK